VSTRRSKLRYLLRSATKRALAFVSRCPNCASTDVLIVDSKFGVTKLVECAQCSLLYRTPTDSAQENACFYQSEYDEGGTTTLPTEEALECLLTGDADQVPVDHTRYLKLFDSLNVPSKSRILDFGCSWGYGTYQMQKAGMRIEGYEPSTIRARYARDKLHLSVTSDEAELRPEFEVFFSSHVLEHVASLQETFHLARRLTKTGGIFLAVTPNGSPEFRQSNWNSFHRLWGLSHPQLLQADFARKAFAGQPLLLASAPYPLDRIAEWNRADLLQCDLRGWELLIVSIL
jgi:SAM-dependent methyltransferase